MRKPLVATVAFLVLTGVVTSQIMAHYLWVTIDPKAGDHGTTNVYFEGGPGPGDGQYLDPFIERGTTWIQTLDSDKATKLEMETVKKPNSRWLSSALPSAGPRSVTSYGKWGVYYYKNIKKDVLLHYYAKNIEAQKASDLEKLGRSEQLNLDIVTKQNGDEVELTVLFNGKPSAKTQVRIYGPSKFNENPSSDADGKVTFTPKAPGLYRLMAKVEENEGGEDDGKEYALIRHQIRVMVRLPAK